MSITDLPLTSINQVCHLTIEANGESHKLRTANMHDNISKDRNAKEPVLINEIPDTKDKFHSIQIHN